LWQPLDLQIEIQTTDLMALVFQPGGQRAQTERWRDFAGSVKWGMSEENPH
jgi:hypothetical protein